MVILVEIFYLGNFYFEFNWGIQGAVENSCMTPSSVPISLCFLFPLLSFILSFSMPLQYTSKVKFTNKIYDYWFVYFYTLGWRIDLQSFFSFFFFF